MQLIDFTNEDTVKQVIELGYNISPISPKTLLI